MVDVLYEGSEPLDKRSVSLLTVAGAEMALGRLRKKQSELRLSLDGQLSDRHRLLLKTIKSHVEELLSITIADTIAQVIAAMKPYMTQWN
ncbi:MAG: hypothetical protein HQL02_08580 [Nitrospirae bacterium]|nr:hypothetical protein [Nitrospirota bacterium]